MDLDLPYCAPLAVLPAGSSTPTSGSYGPWNHLQILPAPRNLSQDSHLPWSPLHINHSTVRSIGHTYGSTERSSTATSSGAFWTSSTRDESNTISCNSDSSRACDSVDFMANSVETFRTPIQFQSNDLYRSHTRPKETTPTVEGASFDSMSARILHCMYPGCSQAFHGTHRRGTMHRHMRLKHGPASVGPEKSFPCEVSDCRKVFKRQDARLKHHRNKHPELGVAAAMPRKDKQSS